MVPNSIPNTYQQQTLCACLMHHCLSSPCLGGWVNQCVVEHLPATMIRVPRNAWRGQTQRVIPISMRGLVGPQCLKGLFVWGVMGALKYAVIGVVVAVVVAAALVLIPPTLHRVAVQYVGLPSGYEAFVPNGQTINYNGHTDPEGDLILNNGTTIRDAIWDGQYANTINQNHDQMVQLNNQFVGKTDPVNNQQYVTLQDFYVIKGQVPVQQVTINGQTYYVIEVDKINPANIAGFYTYDKWVPNFVAAMNTPGTTVASIPGNSPVFTWTNTTGTLVYQTQLYGHYGPFAGRYVLVLPNKIIPYGAIGNIAGASLSNFYSTNQIYNPSS